jgi:signal peptide peptidase SppA
MEAIAAELVVDDVIPAEPAAPPRQYGHIKALLERPWAIQQPMLALMVDLVRTRVEVGPLSEDEITKRLAAARAENGDRNGPAMAGSVAVIPMYGVISQRMSLMSAFSGGTSIDELRASLRQALADPAVMAIVFDIDSPGGSTDGVPEFAAELRAVRGGTKPIVGQVNTLCASAAMWLGANMTELVCTPSGEVGSIGVYAMHEDVSKANEMAGIKPTLISAGEFKVDGNPFEPLTDSARAAIQDQVDAFYSMFVADVARGRKTNADNIEASYGQGRTLLAKPALAAGMVDGIDTLEATVARLQPTRAQSLGRRAADAIQSPALAASGQVSIRPDRAWNRRMKGRLG